MTALDDGLNTSAPAFNTPTLRADWLDLPPGYDANVLVDSVKDLSDQIGPQGFEVTQSLDDGLPDPVTMTTGNDASGTLSSDLNGRQGVEPLASALTWSASVRTSDGTGTSIAADLPTDVKFWDYTIVAITTIGDAMVTETTVTPGTTGSWDLLAEVTDGSGTLYRTWVFGRQHYTGAVAPVFSIDTSSVWAYVSTAVNAGRTAGGAWVAVTPDRAYAVAEGVSAVTSHSTPAVKLPGRGWTVGVFATGSGAGPWTLGGDAVGLVTASGSSIAMRLARSPLRTAARSYTMTATTAVSTAVACLIQIPLVIRERGMQDPSAYFSPFNDFSPIAGFERDTAPMTAGINVVTPTGPVGTTIFTGVMADLPVNARAASLEAVSATRIKLDSEVTVPTVSGSREGATTDWLATFLMAQGGQFAGPRPTRNTRFWAPLHGSLHPHMDGPNAFTSAIYYTTARTPGGQYSLRDAVKAVDGPFVSGMYATLQNNYVESLSIVNDPYNWQTEPPGIDDPLTYDLLSKQNGRGRLSFYIRADPRTPAAAALGGADDYLFRFTLYNLTPTGGAGNYIQFNIRAADGLYEHTLGNAAAALGGAQALPSDGNWHFMGFSWDYVAGNTQGKRNGGNWSTFGHSANINELPTSTADLYSRGLFTNMFIQSKLPISEIDVSFGPETVGATGALTWANWRGPVNYLDTYHNATYRPTRQPLAAIAEPQPVSPWSTLQDVAKSTLSALRINEEDNVEFLPLDYFGETAQMTVSTANILDTSVNAADIQVLADPSKIRNQVTSNYSETRVATSRSSVLEITSAITVPPGESFQTFALDKPIAETHGAAFWQYTAPDIQKLTALQIAGTNPIQNEHVMSVNFLADGNGTVVAASIFQARIVNWDNSSVTIRFRNRYPATLYLVNNGNQIPYLRILGYEIQRADAYTTVRDPGSIGLRKLRGLASDMPWIHDRATATDITTKLVSITARPRPQLTVTVMGDPRRRPGMLTTLVDASGTQVDGTWRILAVHHKSSGAQYTQDLELVRQGEVALWDSGLWDSSVWGA